MGEGFRSTRLAPRHNHNTHERLWWRGSKTAFKAGPQGWPELPLLQATPSPGPIRGLMPNILRRVHIILLRAACRGRSQGQMEEII